MYSVDARGVSCPEPVLMVKNAVAKGNKSLEILVDNNTAMNNVSRFLKNKGFSKVTIDEIGEDIHLKAEK
jgi:TusA-related sulfurtransferase